MEWEYMKPYQLNGAIFNDLELPLTPISMS